MFVSVCVCVCVCVYAVLGARGWACASGGGGERSPPPFLLDVQLVQGFPTPLTDSVCLWGSGAMRRDSVFLHTFLGELKMRTEHLPHVTIGGRCLYLYLS